MILWTVDLLGMFRVKDATNATRSFQTEDEMKLLVYLLYFNQRPHLNKRITDMLWPSLGPEQRHSIFHTSLNRLQQQFSTQEGSAILCRGDKVKVDIRYFSVDILRIKMSIQQANQCQNVQRRLSYLEKIVQKDYGTLLSQFDDGWLVSERLQWHTLYLTVLHRLVVTCLELKRTSAATAYAQLAVNIAPYSERTHLDLIKAYIARGHAASAQRHYLEAKRIFNQDLKKTISPIADELMQRTDLCKTEVNGREIAT